MEDLDITKTEVIESIRDYIEPLMLENGFKWMKSKKEFKKKTDFGFYSLSFNIINFWPLKQDLNISLNVKYPKIQNVFSLFSTNKETKNHATVARWLVLPNSDKLQYKELYVKNDIKIAKVEALKCIKDEAFIFFQKYSDLKEVAFYYRDMYEKTFKGKKISCYFKTLIKVIILFRISNCINEYEEIRNNYKEYAKKSIIPNHETLSFEEKCEKLLKVFNYLEENH